MHDVRLVALMNVHQLKHIITFNARDFDGYGVSAVSPGENRRRLNARHTESGSPYFFSATPNSLSLAATSAAWVAVFTALSMKRILPSLPM